MSTAELKKTKILTEADQCSEFIEQLDVEIENSLILIDLYREDFLKNKIDEMNTVFVELVNSLQHFMLNLFHLKNSGTLSNENKVNDFFSILACSDEELLAVLKEILRAKENKDLVHLNDMLEFGLRENLYRWRDIFIPAIKGLLI